MKNYNDPEAFGKSFTHLKNLLNFFKVFYFRIRALIERKKCSIDFKLQISSGLLVFLLIACSIQDAYSQLPPCDPADCGEELFCYGDFEDLTPSPTGTSTYFDQLGLQYCPSLVNAAVNTPDVICTHTGNENVGIRLGYTVDPYNEAIYFPLSNGLQPDCLLQIDYQAVQFELSHGNLMFYGSEAHPCTLGPVPITGSSSGGFFFLDQFTPSGTYPGFFITPFCAFDIDNYYESSTFNWLNTTNEIINYITIVVTNPNNEQSGSTVIDNISVIAECKPTFTYDPVGCSNTIDFFSDEQSGTHLWTVTPGNQTFTDPNPTITFPTGTGSYTVTHTINGNASEERIFSFAGTDVNSVTPVTLLHPSALTDQFLLVHGTLIINHSGYLFRDLDAKMVDGSTIKLYDGYSIRVEDSEFMACGERLWKGFDLDAGGKLTMHGSLVEDAEFAVKTAGSGSGNMAYVNLFGQYF